jgi:hypothetical protein
MGSRAEELAGRFEEAMREFTAVVEGCSEEQWLKAKGPEGWPVAATAQHVSGQFPLEMEYITAAAEGRELPAYTWDDINGKNDGRAAKNMAASKEQVLSELRELGSSAAAYVRGLSDEQLDRKSKLALAGGAEVSTQQLIEGGVLIDHVKGHTESIRGAG